MHSSLVYRFSAWENCQQIFDRDGPGAFRLSLFLPFASPRSLVLDDCRPPGEILARSLVFVPALSASGTVTLDLPLH